MTEMYTCESSAQVFAFLLRVFSEDINRLRYLGYDRGCEFEPFLKNLAKKGNVGAELLLENVEFLVDIFHVLKHTSNKCMPLENPECRYHPRLERFKEIWSANTECAEQTFKWLGMYKYMLRRMTQYKFKFLIWCLKESRNKRITLSLQQKKML